MKKYFALLMTCVLLMSTVIGIAQGASVDVLSQELESTDMTNRPQVRWWMAEGSHTDETIIAAIQELYDSGIGGVEFVTLTTDADDALYAWGSEEWVQDSHLIIETCTKLGMGVSFTSGTNWSCANLTTITPDDKAASKVLDYSSEIVEGGATRTGALMPCELTDESITKMSLVGVVAVEQVSATEEETVLKMDSVINLTGSVVNDELTWTAPDEGTWELITMWMHGSGQTASPAVSTAYCVDYMDGYGIEALIDYWEEVVLTDEMKELIAENGQVQMYMDSLEIRTGPVNLQWGEKMISEFEARCGYDVTPYLPFLMASAMGHTSIDYVYTPDADEDGVLADVQRDLYQVMTELYMENMLEPMQAWVHENNMTLRAEISYCMPYEISEPGVAVDSIETESLEFLSQIDCNRNLAGVAHLTGKQLSSETGAARPNNSLTLQHQSQVVYLQFAAGVSRTQLHVYSTVAGPETNAAWPGFNTTGWGDRWGSRQTYFDNYTDWTDMVARSQTILNEGTPRVDLAILRLDYDFDMSLSHRLGAGMEGYTNSILRAGEAYYWQDMGLQYAGFTYDYLAPQLMESEYVDYADGMINADGVAYKAILVYQDMLPYDSALALLDLAKSGMPIIFADNNYEHEFRAESDHYNEVAAAFTPYNDGLDEALADVVAQIKACDNVITITDESKAVEALASLGVTPRTAYSEPSDTLLTFTREDDEATYVYVYNYMYSDDNVAQTTLSIEATGKPYMIDAWTGEITAIGDYTVADGYTNVNITLDSGEMTFIAVYKNEADDVWVTDTNAAQSYMDESGIYAVAYESGTLTSTLSNGETVTSAVEVPEAIELPVWNLTVESYTAGETEYITEDRGLGYVTTEATVATLKTPIEVGETALLPWSQIEAVGNTVSGVGYYSTTVTLSDVGAYGLMLDLDSTSGMLAAVYVNGVKADPVDIDNPVVDISGLVTEGDNEIMVEVSSTLMNALLANGTMTERDGDPQDYGMVGVAQLIPYVIVPIH